MNELFKRAITGFLYIFLLLSAIKLDVDAFDFLFLIFGLACLLEFKKLVHLPGYSAFVSFLLLWWIFMHLKVDLFFSYLLLFISLMCCVYLVSLLFSNTKETQLPNEHKFMLALFYIGGGCLFLPFIYRLESDNGYHLADAQVTMIGILCIIWVSDSFAYIVGKNFGKKKLFEKISPKKTVEGFWGGFFGALITSCIISYYSDKPLWKWIILGIVLIISGTLGDLVESKFKRSANTKDSGTLLPGHGGLLDRLDSLIFASPFAFLTLLILDYFKDY